MREINVLFSSVGRRVELVNSFRKAKEKLGISGKLVGVDMDELAPALRFVDIRYKVPRLDSEDFITSIIEICNKENISLIIPTIDTELEIYAINREKIESNTNARIMVSSEKSINIIRDKIATCKFMEENNIGVPKLVTEEDIINKKIKFPLFIKPLDGSSSINAFKVNNMEELLFFNKYIPNPIIQEFAEGQEYCVDVFCDFDSEVISVVPKMRISHRSGEITKSKIIKDREIIDLAKKIVKVLKPIGEINFDCIKTKDGIKVIEINGRFAGGAPISFQAGADSPTKLYKLLMGEKLEYNEDFKDEMIALRFDDAVYLDSKEVI